MASQVEKEGVTLMRRFGMVEKADKAQEGWTMLRKVGEMGEIEKGWRTKHCRTSSTSLQAMCLLNSVQGLEELVF